MEFEKVETDVLIVGGGAAGLRAGLSVRENSDARSLVLSKVPAIRSHTAAARGGIGAARQQGGADGWRSHAADTIRAGAGLCDRDAVKVLCKQAPGAVQDLVQRGVGLNLDESGGIERRLFAGHKKNTGEPVKRACYAEDRTGQILLHGLHESCLRKGVKIEDEQLALRLITTSDGCAGLTAWDLAAGRLKVYLARSVLLATGGHGRLYEFTTNSIPCTGDGLAMAAAEGLPLQDLEFYQFHPTALVDRGILITGAARSVGGVLRNGKGERFMKEYAPREMEMAPRDKVSRAIVREIQAGRGVQGQDHVNLDLTELNPGLIQEHIPEVQQICQNYLDLDPGQEPIPVKPAAHYSMGGIPTDTEGRVHSVSGRPVPGLFAAGETACVSVHGANRLGTNSLAETLVFGNRIGRELVATAHKRTIPDPPDLRGHLKKARELLSPSKNDETLRRELRQCVSQGLGIFRNQKQLKETEERISALTEALTDTSEEAPEGSYRYDAQRRVELINLLVVARLSVRAADYRNESRGSHYRTDHSGRGKPGWRHHSLAYRENGEIKVKPKPVRKTPGPAN